MDDEALLERAREEREKLFERYELGREKGAEIYPWEDPVLEYIPKVDRYGFIHDSPMSEDAPSEIRAKSLEIEREKKWLKMLKNWKKGTPDKLQKRIYKGIPEKFRSEVWLKLLNVEQLLRENTNIYQEMLKIARQWGTEAKQIDSDVNRQFRDHIDYRERYSIKQKSLFNVLVAYSMYNMEVGYCQGMAGLASVLLMYLNEEEAFWALSALLTDKKYAMHGFFVEGFPKLTRFLAHHDRIIEKFMPKLKKHFDLYNLDSMLYSLKWYFIVFVERLPFSLCLRIWDIYLLHGERVISAMAYTILRLHKNKILKLKDMDLIVEYIQVKLYKDFGYEDDFVIKALEQSMESLRKANLELPPPASEQEFPKKPFGKFVEPSFEAKIGRRKPEFTNTEKEVTTNVILQRELTAQEIAESSRGSNSQLNTAQIAESEDGCSLLGSSRKSLADTSVTSTADLSIFSGGEQRSQQAYSLTYDNDNKSIGSAVEEADGDSSPGSVVARSSSALMIASTVTPRAMSPDVVRIYVPPAPPDEMEKLSNKYKSQETICPTVINKNYDTSSQYGSRRNSQTYSMTSLNNKVLEEVTGSDYISSNGIYSSSSRRGSMSRKSPSPLLDNEYIIECSHFKGSHRRSTDNLNSLKLNISTSNISESNNKSFNSHSMSTSSNMRKNDKNLTSFEELAIKKSQENILLKKQYQGNVNPMTKSDYYDYVYYNERTARHESPNHNYQHHLSPDHQTSSQSFSSYQSPRKNYSDYNIKYSNTPSYDGGERRRRHNSSDNDDSPFNKKDVYSRFYNDECYDDENDKLILYKSSDDSISSPQNTKSVLSTPINEIGPPINERKISSSSGVGGMISAGSGNGMQMQSPYKINTNMEYDEHDLYQRNIRNSSSHNSINSKKQSKIPLYHSPVVSPTSNSRLNKKSSPTSNNSDNSSFNFNNSNNNKNNNNSSHHKNSKANNNYSLVNEGSSVMITAASPNIVSPVSNKANFEKGNNSKIAMPIGGYYNNSNKKSDTNKIKITINNQNNKQSESN